jgi:hypothetical protein
VVEHGGADAYLQHNQGRIFCSLGNLPTLQHMTVYRGAVSPTTIHTQVLADALSETSNKMKSLGLFGLKISCRSEVDQLARGLQALAESLEILRLEGIVLDVKDESAFLDPILFALTNVPGEPRSQLSTFRLSCAEAVSSGASVVPP